MKLLTRFGEIDVEPGVQWEPIYRARENGNGKVIDFAWFCPHCGGEYRTRKSCHLHCAGKQGMFVATCPYLKQHQCSQNCKLYRHPGRKYVGGPLFEDVAA